ncbi:UDP-N-acetylmuramate dehydrogenase [Ruminococcus sp. YE71]|uniref:UDP-N-acetylmuramate dehydrogenase n=1 Tax=unclassified Ruminococcus TaxID=2608920 RepID=UPI00088CCBCE|nr:MULTISPECIES: UDP-N-acetylmuramate dehydrogenase [unclassified Ruminococcus]SDA23840.1 UDP-N-acetylmuramate dehydrogenase [Ruminococcus sp. YE78]SFW40607.1 UDP-N-acetylmuramate dehydrogenase [Ruminococcus sp. YE71]
MHFNELSEFAEGLGCTVMRDEPLSKHTTFRIGGPCRLMIVPDSAEALASLRRFTGEKGIRTLIIGKGSNMLCADEGFDGAVILLDKTFGKIELISDDTIRAEAGAQLISVCTKALEHSLTGLEFAYGIPGTVGGGIFMNAGAYGGEMRNVIESVTAVDRNGEFHTYSADELAFTYRSSRFAKSDEVIVSGDFKLSHGDKDEISAEMERLMGCRRSKQPLDFPNAGSTFKRPEEDVYVGKLIQDNGLRGKTIGGAQVSEKHCGFVVNKGGATCDDVTSLIKMIQDTIKERTGYSLECEVRIIPYK